jgi:hypothetical protein
MQIKKHDLQTRSEVKIHIDYFHILAHAILFVKRFFVNFLQDLKTF